MPYKDLKDFIADLEAEGELLRIAEEVDPILEITEITDKISKYDLFREELTKLEIENKTHTDEYKKLSKLLEDHPGNKALLFENPKGYDMPLLINSMGSHKRMQMALGVSKEEKGYDAIADRIRKFIKPEVPDSFKGKFQKLLELSEVKNFLPKTVSKGKCQEVVVYPEEGEKLLDKLPLLKCWPDDGGQYLTLTCVFTKDPDKLGAGRNVGMYRLQKLDNETTAMHWHKHHDGAENYRKSLKNGALGVKSNGKPNLESKKASGPKTRMEIAVVVGADPAVIYSATAPLPPAIDEMILAGFIRNKSVEMVKCKTIDVEVPADAEIVIEGYIDLAEDLVMEGPFGDHTGFYSLADLYPKFHVTAITHQKNPIYATTIVGIPPQEDCYMGKATERVFLPLLQLICPEVVDMNLPWDGVFHNCALVSIDKKYPGHAQKVMNTIWGTGQMSWTKYIVIFDKDVDIHDYHETTMHAFGNTDPGRDMIFTKGPLDILDHAAPALGYGSKAGIDATCKWEGEGFTREWPELIEMDSQISEKSLSRWSKLFP